MNSFLQNIQAKNLDSFNTADLEEITTKFPYFQLAKTVLLKKYRVSEHFKYNTTLKNVAAHTIDREVLFDYINHIEEEKETQKTTEPTISQNKEDEYSTEVKSILKELEKPLEFTSTEKHSFNKWLQLNQPKPIDRILDIEVNVESPLNTKMNAIDNFLLNKPKISPAKKNTTTDSSIEKSIKNNTNQLMTETLAKVYIAQKKYNDAIQAYKILSLKYPEKNSFFADQIAKIEILQKNKS